MKQQVQSSGLERHSIIIKRNHNVGMCFNQMLMLQVGFCVRHKSAHEKQSYRKRSEPPKQ
jgi:hypothetical protein